MEFNSKLRGRVINSQSREIIANVIEFMRREGNFNSPSIPFKNVNDRVAAATGVSKNTVVRISGEKKRIDNREISEFSSPRKTIKKPKTVNDIDEADKGILKRIILFMLISENIVPTLKTILTKFREATGYKGSYESLRKIIKSLGFRWRKTKTNRKILMERFDIQKLRLDYLIRLKSYRAEGRPIVYLDETYIHASHTHQKAWSDNSNEGLKKPINKGDRLIIVHAGGEMGFIPNARLIFKSGTKSGDYHDEMNFNNFSKWLKEKLFPNLPPRSVIIVDNAPYHNVQVNKAPTSTSKKADMQDWLRNHNIAYEEDMLKTQLYSLVLLHKSRFKRYAIEEMINEHGFSCLRLPPYHPDLNPIELVWASLKQYVASNNTTFKRQDVQLLCEDFFDTFSKEEWQSRCNNAKMWESKFYDREVTLDEATDRFIINLNSDSETDFESDMETEESFSEDH